MRQWFWSAAFWLGMSLSFGVLAREWTRAVDFTGDTALFRLHGHALILGFFCSLLILILLRVFQLTLTRRFFWFFQMSLFIFMSAMAIRGGVQILGTELIGLNYYAGIGHIMLSISLIWLLSSLYRALRPYESFHTK